MFEQWPAVFFHTQKKYISLHPQVRPVVTVSVSGAGSFKIRFRECEILHNSQESHYLQQKPSLQLCSPVAMLRGCSLKSLHTLMNETSMTEI